MQSNFATILPQHADVSESASSAHGILGMWADGHDGRSRAVDAVHTTDDLHAIDELARWRVVQTAREMDGLHVFENAKGARLSF